MSHWDKFNYETIYVKESISGIVKKMNSKKRNMFNITKEFKQLNTLIESPPEIDECFKMLSVGGGFSSLGIITYIATKETIEELYCSTFRIGKHHFETLIDLHAKNKLKQCHFITSQTQQRTDTKYNYFEFIEKQCETFGWKLKCFNNHSKLILMQTDKNYYVVETSSNLNENPKMEQFNWENDKELYDWYKELFIELMK